MALGKIILTLLALFAIGFFYHEIFDPEIQFHLTGPVSVQGGGGRFSTTVSNSTKSYTTNSHVYIGSDGSASWTENRWTTFSLLWVWGSLGMAILLMLADRFLKGTRRPYRRPKMSRGWRR